jgi:putative FmdB family regulatory protein
MLGYALGRVIMPTYDYFCEKCKKSFTLVMPIRDYEKNKARCPKCKGKRIKQQITAFTTITSSKS